MPFRRRFSFISAIGAACALLAPAGASAATCTSVAAPSGSDTGSGTVGSPFRTAQKVIESLEPGDTGCLRTGVYDDEVNGPFVANFFTGGRRGARITLRSYPGERAALRGVTTVTKGANYVTISGLTIDGRRPKASDTPVGIQLMARHTRLEDNDISDPSANCVGLGVEGWGTAVGNVIQRNVFHDCGTTQDGLHDHAIYANAARGGRIADNLIVRSAAFAVQFYGRNEGVRVSHNVMVDNGGGVIFAGYGANVSSRNVVTRNVIANSSQRPGVLAYWDGRTGSGNVARDNCLIRNADREVDPRAGGFSATSNLTADPGFVDLGRGDLRLASGSPCLPVVRYDTAGRLSGADAVAAMASIAR